MRSQQDSAAAVSGQDGGSATADNPGETGPQPAAQNAQTTIRGLGARHTGRRRGAVGREPGHGPDGVVSFEFLR